MDLEQMTSFTHRGATYYADDMERIFDADGKLLGYICSRGAQYGWGALLADETEFARGNGIWEPKADANDSPDPALDAILHAHAFRCGVCEGRGKVKAYTHSETAKVPCTYCNGTGVADS